MSTQKLLLNVSGFTDGLNTEASVLNVLPSELMLGSTNVEILQNGSIRRRRGVDFIGESDAGDFLQTLRTSTVDNEVFQESPNAIYARLTAPDGSSIERVIVATNNQFLIYEPTRNNIRNIDAPLQTINRTGKAANLQQFYPTVFAVSGNRVFFAGQHCLPGYIYVDTDNISLTVTYIDVIIRDPSAEAANTRVSRNSKWYECIEAHTSDSTNSPGDGTGDWERYWFVLEGAIPSGTSAWNSGQNYTSTFIKRYNKLDTPTASDFYPSAVEFFAGRLWLAGDPKHPNVVYFSQVVANDADLEKFHQFADPFDETDPAVVDDDGGVMVIQGTGIIRQLVTLRNSMFVGTSAGVWQISGPDGIFKATNFSTALNLRDPVPNMFSMVTANDQLFVFAADGIWRANIETSLSTSVSGEASFKSVSRNRVDAIYTNTPINNKRRAKAVFNPSDNRIYYFFNSSSTAFDTSYGRLLSPGYAREVLVIDTSFRDDAFGQVNLSSEQTKRNVTGAFFLYQLADTASDEKPYIACPFIAPQIPIASTLVVADGEQVTDGAGENVVAAAEQSVKNDVLFIALQRLRSGSVVTLKIAFGTLVGDAVTDWTSDTDYKTSFTSRVLSGVQTMGDVLHNKAGTYLFFVFKKVESGTLTEAGIDTTPGGCYLRTAWQWATSTTSTRYSPQYQIYIPDRLTYATAGSGLDGHDHTWYKFRMRGRGNAMQIILENEGDKDFYLIGWAQQFYGKND